jgi:flagellar hook-length control protein FliK
MITQNAMLGFMQKSQTFSVGAKSGLFDEKAASTKLTAPNEREAFNIQLKAAEDRRNLNRKQPPESREPLGKNKAKFNAYRNAAENEKKPEMKETKEVSSDIEKESSMKDKDTQKVKKAASEEISQEEIAIAQALGIQPEAFRKILEDLNIGPQDLQNEANIPAIIQSISQKLGLNSEQENALKELVEGVIKLMGLKSPDDEVALTDVKVNEINTEDIKAKSGNVEEVSEQKGEAPKISIDELAEKLKEKIQELTQKFRDNPESVKKELTKIVENMMEKYGKRVMVDESANNEAATDAQHETVKAQSVNMEKSTVAGEANKEDSQEPKEFKNTRADKTEENSKASSEQTTGKAQEQVHLKSSKEDLSIDSKADIKSINSNLQSVGTVENGGLSKTAGDMETLKTLKEQPVTKRDILTQVIDKAKVVFNGDKSEMVLSLRPESLGKLSLKVVTEHGIITAKFIAESQQVKEVLESNMQLLKDTLEKQGVSIQGLSVSVDSNTSREFNGHKNNNDGVKTGNGRVKTVGKNSIASMEAAANLEKMNPYIMGENRINLTA